MQSFLETSTEKVKDLEFYIISLCSSFSKATFRVFLCQCEFIVNMSLIFEYLSFGLFNVLSDHKFEIFQCLKEENLPQPNI